MAPRQPSRDPFGVEPFEALVVLPLVTSCGRNSTQPFPAVAAVRRARWGPARRQCAVPTFSRLLGFWGGGRCCFSLPRRVLRVGRRDPASGQCCRCAAAAEASWSLWRDRRPGCRSGQPGERLPFPTGASSAAPAPGRGRCSSGVLPPRRGGAELPTKGPTNGAERLHVERIAARLLGRHPSTLAWLADQITCYARCGALLGRPIILRRSAHD